jgi:hypothetical protein
MSAVTSRGVAPMASARAPSAGSAARSCSCDHLLQSTHHSAALIGQRSEHDLALTTAPDQALAVQQLVGSTFAGFATWIAERSQRPMRRDEADAIAALGLGSLFSSRLLRDVLGVALRSPTSHSVEAWVQMMAAALGAPA